MTNAAIIQSSNLDEDIDRGLMGGYRMEMIMPSDAPHEVLMSKGSDRIKIVSKNRQRTSNVNWAVGRAGMMYRDLIPDRLGGRVIASHIRIVEGGEVPDSVHYHKIDFQVIYCLKGAIRVVYEGQGEPFWLEPGDCVLQAPEIRHRVLEAEAGSEVIEITSPAEHETWFDHKLELPTSVIETERSFNGQKFVLHKDKDSKWQDSEMPNILISETRTEGVATLKAETNVPDLVSVERSDVWEIAVLVEGQGIKVNIS